VANIDTRATWSSRFLTVHFISLHFLSSALHFALIASLLLLPFYATRIIFFCIILTAISGVVVFVTNFWTSFFLVGIIFTYYRHGAAVFSLYWIWDTLLDIYWDTEPLWHSQDTTGHRKICRAQNITFFFLTG
jgi:hypothetical protein